jgi:hypothetical protein
MSRPKVNCSLQNFALQVPFKAETGDSATGLLALRINFWRRNSPNAFLMKQDYFYKLLKYLSIL